jgi:hypothetical protein
MMKRGRRKIMRLHNLIQRYNSVESIPVKNYGLIQLEDKSNKMSFVVYRENEETFLRSTRRFATTKKASEWVQSLLDYRDFKTLHVKTMMSYKPQSTNNLN